MTAERLRQYRNIKLEISYVSDEIHKLERVAIVQGSDNEYPYTKHNFRISGLDESSLRKNELLKRIGDLKNQQKQIEDYIRCIDDTELRLIFTYRYIRGLTWQQIANKLKVCGDGSTERKKHNRFLKVSRNSRKRDL